MSIPFVFKPILINRKVTESFPENHLYNREYQGLWVDGGMLLNFPLHAFDVYAKLTLTPGDAESYQVAIPPEPGQVTEFNKKVLGFRLMTPKSRSSMPLTCTRRMRVSLANTQATCWIP